MFFAVIAAALAIAVIIGGDVRRLSQLRIRHIELLLAAFATKVAVALLGTAHSEIAVTAARPLNVIGAVLLLVALRAGLAPVALAGFTGLLAASVLTGARQRLG